MKCLFLLLPLLATTSIYAQTDNHITILDNVNFELNRIGLQNRIKLGAASIQGDKVSAQFYTPEDKKVVLNLLKQSKDFKSSNGLSLFLYHRGASQSFRQLSDPSLHIVWYEDRIELHFDMHCPGITHPVKSYRHFREVVVNWIYNSATSQRRVAVELKRNQGKANAAVNQSKYKSDIFNPLTTFRAF